MYKYMMADSLFAAEHQQQQEVRTKSQQSLCDASSERSRTKESNKSKISSTNYSHDQHIVVPIQEEIQTYQQVVNSHS